MEKNEVKSAAYVTALNGVVINVRIISVHRAWLERWYDSLGNGVSRLFSFFKPKPYQYRDNNDMVHHAQHALMLFGLRFVWFGHILSFKRIIDKCVSLKRIHESKKVVKNSYAPLLHLEYCVDISQCNVIVIIGQQSYLSITITHSSMFSQANSSKCNVLCC